MGRSEKGWPRNWPSFDHNSGRTGIHNVGQGRHGVGGNGAMKNSQAREYVFVLSTALSLAESAHASGGPSALRHAIPLGAPRNGLFYPAGLGCRVLGELVPPPQ